MYFGIQQMQTWNIEPFEFYDKMLLKKNYKDLGVRPCRTLWRDMVLTLRGMWC